MSLQVKSVPSRSQEEEVASGDIELQGSDTDFLEEAVPTEIIGKVHILQADEAVALESGQPFVVHRGARIRIVPVLLRPERMVEHVGPSH